MLNPCLSCQTLCLGSNCSAANAADRIEADAFPKEEAHRQKAPTVVTSKDIKAVLKEAQVTTPTSGSGRIVLERKNNALKISVAGEEVATIVNYQGGLRPGRTILKYRNGVLINIRHVAR